MRTKLGWMVPALTVALVGGCGKVQEKASEKVIEKAIESAAQKDGTKAKVDLAEGSMKITTTDASGKTMTAEYGGAKVTESDFGVPFYPGTAPLEGSATRMMTGDGTMTSVTLRTDDPVDKVAAFYRERLKSLAGGKQFMDMSSNEGATMALADDKTRETIQVHIAKADKGTDLHIVASRTAAK